MNGGAQSDSVRRLIDRPRITALLLQRFDHPLTIVRAPAGSGKTSAVNQAIENNLLDPRGTDYLVTAPRNGADPLQLLSRIAATLGVSDDGHHSTTAIRARIVEAIWSHAPDEVAVIVDDVHHLLPGADEEPGTAPEFGSGVDELHELLHELPRNGHLVLASRHDVPIPVGRLRAHGALLEITADTLEFDDGELDELRSARAAALDAPLPRHAASADLQLAAGTAAGVEFLREEVLAALDPDRLRHLRRMAVFEEFDTELVNEMTDGAFDAEKLLSALPLVEWGSGGTHRLHSLLRETLLDQQPPGEQRKAASVGGDLLLARSRHAAAMRLHLLAGDEIAARDAAREFVLGPMLNQTISDIAEIRRLLATFDDGGPLHALLDASLHFDGREQNIAERFAHAAELAQAAGDELLEVLALHRSLQAQFLDIRISDELLQQLDRLDELSASVPIARGAIAHARSQLAQHSGDAETALAVLDAVAHLEELNELVNRDQRLCDLGRPEDVAVGLTPDDLARLPPGSEVFIAFGMWLRGEGSPEFANEFVGAMLDDVATRGFDHTMISTLGTATPIAVAAGDTVNARRRSDQACDLVQRKAPRTIELFATIARATVAADGDSDEAAADLLDPEATGLPIDPWPLRAHLLALPLIYVTRPESRSVLDSIEFGPSLNCAVAAGRALVALREDDDVDPAASLPWSWVDVLRVHVLPHHLTELACAALLTDTPGAEDVLSTIPHLDRYLARVANERRSSAASRAATLLGGRPRVAPHTLRLDLLGDVRLLRDGHEVTDDDWLRRSRVRELLALLSERRRIDRHELIDTLWPDHDDDAKADSNFRAHLSKLQHVLEPGRPRDVDPYFLRSDGDSLVLHEDLHTDVDEFEERVETARRNDVGGVPARALEGHLDAVRWFRGDYLLGVQAGWPVLTRLRLRALALDSLCRIAELTAARGEPEDAARWAERARRLDPLSERAARILVGSLIASGDRSTAAAAAAELAARFDDHGIVVEAATTRAFERAR